jgi:hypothetical protein
VSFLAGGSKTVIALAANVAAMLAILGGAKTGSKSLIARLASIQSASWHQEVGWTRAFTLKTIKRWWARNPLANLGLACGRSGLIVADIDPRHGSDEISFWEKAVERVDTVRTLTPSGGIHLWFSAPPGEFTVSVGRFLTGVDIRAGNGYVMPRSNHILNEPYHFESGHSRKEINIAACPSVLAEFARRETIGNEQPGTSKNGSDAGDQQTGFDILGH